MLRPLLLVLPFLMAGISSASALNIKWTVNDASFNTGGMLTGSFVWESIGDTVISSNMMTTSDGGFFAGNTYTDGAGAIDPNFIDFPGAGNLKVRLYLTTFDLDTPVANLPMGATSGGFFECYNCSPFRTGTGTAYLSGEVQKTPPTVPLPASAALLAGGCFMIGFRRRMRVS